MTNTGSRKRILIPGRILADVKAKEKRDYAEHVVSKLYTIADNTGLWSIRMQGGGCVPLPLRGWYTKESYALDAIEKYYKIND
jgi:hypothetical protein